ncbi:MAG: 2-C-methyl-D-erythritol 2,4-cyclodiphosphate synthase [candidate division WOR-3 bacterium]
MNDEIPYRIGIGFDAHELKRGRPFVLGGTPLPYHLGLSGHSDGDVLLHALMDAILGALALPDIGVLFPVTSPEYKNIDSRNLLKMVLRKMRQRKWRLAQIDCVIVCDRPKLAPHTPLLRKTLASLLKLRENMIGLKAKTTEGTRFALPNKSVSALVVTLLVPKPKIQNR